VTEHSECPHDFDQHMLLTTGSSPTDGGVIICHVKGCMCLTTWDVPQLGGTRENIRVPDDEELESLRKELQTTE
jgi:hypothetical protein